MRVLIQFVSWLLVASAAALLGCSERVAKTPAKGGPVQQVMALGGGQSDVDKVRNADVSILFIGNSHTMNHDLPNLVRGMIEFRHPEKTVYVHAVAVGFLEDAGRNPGCIEEIENRPWKSVVLQAQKISVSGKHEYSRKEGIDLAKKVKKRGAAAFFFSEWGLLDDPTNGPRHEKVYVEMANESAAVVVPVGRAWTVALAQRPELTLYEGDGNHQTALGAFLTACTLVGRIMNENPEPLAKFEYLQSDEETRKLLAHSASRALGFAGKE